MTRAAHPQAEKWCPRCGVVKAAANFRVRRERGTLDSVCRKCRNDLRRMYRLGTPGAGHRKMVCSPQELREQEIERDKAFIRARVNVVDAGHGAPCWLWKLSLNPKGYAQVAKNGYHIAHRLSYSLFVGELAPNLQIDHLCRNRNCVNPAHLELVTPAENSRRALPFRADGKWSHCKNGHELNGKNRTSKGSCRICTNAYAVAYRNRRKGATRD